MPEPTRAELIEKILDAQTAMFHAFQSKPIPKWLSLDLTLGQLRALFFLFQAGPTPIGQLGAMLGLGRPAASLLVDALVRQGFVLRFEDPVDRRRTLASLSSEAQRLITEQYLGNSQQFATWLDRLSSEDLSHLARVLSEVAAVASRDAQLAAV